MDFIFIVYEVNEYTETNVLKAFRYIEFAEEYLKECEDHSNSSFYIKTVEFLE